jgi:two-component system, chemotaxis family, sensor kinase CheA
MIFRAGFSTRSSASDVSGRGIGLYVVRRAVESLGGTVSVASELGLWTRFTLSVPASASKQRLLVLQCGGDLYAIPSRDVVSVTKAGWCAISEAPSGGAAFEWNGARIPLRSIASALGVDGGEAEPWIIVVKEASSAVGISAELVLGERELHRRPADALVAATGVFVGSATLDDGRLVLVVSTPGLLRRSAQRLARRS